MPVAELLAQVDLPLGGTATTAPPLVPAVEIEQLLGPVKLSEPLLEMLQLLAFARGVGMACVRITIVRANNKPIE